VMPIYYASDAHGPIADAFVQSLTQGTYWSITTSEYGVGPITPRQSQQLPGTPPASMIDDDLQTLIAQNLMGASPPWGEPDPTTVYMFIVPPGTSFSQGMAGQGGSCCQEFDGYHSELFVGSTHVPYAVICACAGFDGRESTDVVDMTVAASHELIEASTDPYVQSHPAYNQADMDHAAWTVVSSGELGDMCEFNLDAEIVPADGTFFVQRTWSNKAAAAGLNPCVPAPAAFANAVPILPDVGSVQYYEKFTTRVVKIAAGQTATVEVPVYTSQIMGPSHVKVYDAISTFYGGDSLLDMHLDRDTANNGDTLQLTITPTGFDSYLKADIFIIETDFGDNMSLSMGVVVKP
jgi:hypothetical protein